MPAPNFLRRFAGLTLLTLGLCATANATVILDVTTALTLSDPTQFGRLSRNGVTQDWIGSEPFPGLVNPSTEYHYRTFEIDAATVALGPYIQISLDDPLPNLFVSAYFTSYAPNSLGSGALGFETHWLGDPGFSGNAFGLDPVFFQVIVPAGTSLVVVVNDATAAGLGVGEYFNLVVESFRDTDYTPAANAPDGGNSAALLGVALGCLALLRRALRPIASHS